MNALSSENILFIVTGKVVHGEKLGRKLGFPTANLKPEAGFNYSGALGVYAVIAEFDNLSFRGICNVGFRPTVNGSTLVTEVHLFDFNADLYDKTLDVKFIARIREEKKFNSLAELVEQIENDKAFALKLFSGR